MRQEMDTEWDSTQNYYLIVNDDPGFIHVVNEKSLLLTLAESVCDDNQSGWVTCLRNIDGNLVEAPKPSTKDLRKIMEWLNKDYVGVTREPSPYFIVDEDAYNHIRRITKKD